MFHGEELVVAKLVKKFAISHETIMLVTCRCLFLMPVFCTVNGNCLCRQAASCMFVVQCTMI